MKYQLYDDRVNLCLILSSALLQDALIFTGIHWYATYFVVPTICFPKVLSPLSRKSNDTSTVSFSYIFSAILANSLTCKKYDYHSLAVETCHFWLLGKTIPLSTDK